MHTKHPHSLELCSGFLYATPDAYSALSLVLHCTAPHNVSEPLTRMAQQHHHGLAVDGSPGRRPRWPPPHRPRACCRAHTTSCGPPGGSSATASRPGCPPVPTAEPQNPFATGGLAVCHLGCWRFPSTTSSVSQRLAAGKGNCWFQTRVSTAMMGWHPNNNQSIERHSCEATNALPSRVHALADEMTERLLSAQARETAIMEAIQTAECPHVSSTEIGPC